MAKEDINKLYTYDGFALPLRSSIVNLNWEFRIVAHNKIRIVRRNPKEKLSMDCHISFERGVRFEFSIANNWRT